MRGSFQAWLIVAVGFVGLAASFTARSALGLAMPQWEQEFDWSRSLVSAGGAAALVIMAVAAPVTGGLADRYGPRAFMALGLVLVAAGMAATTAMAESWHFFLAFSLLAGLGFGTVAMHVVSTGVAGAFERRRGLAVGIATAGATAGQLLLMPVAGSILADHGWRIAFWALACLALLVALAAWRVLRPGAVAPTKAVAAPVEPLAGRLSGLARSPVFWALLVSYVICGFTTTGVIEVHLLPYAAACGFPPQATTTAYGVLCAFNLIGMVTAGYLSDRMHRPLLLGLIYIVRGLSFLFLMGLVDELPLLFAFAVVFGLFDYATVPVTASLVASHLGLRVMGLAMGILSAGHALGAAGGALLGGILYDLFAKYLWVWGASVVLAMGAGFIAFTIAERRGTRDAAPVLA
jgi:MFS family permease